MIQDSTHRNKGRSVVGSLGGEIYFSVEEHFDFLDSVMGSSHYWSRIRRCTVHSFRVER